MRWELSQRLAGLTQGVHGEQRRQQPKILLPTLPRHPKATGVKHLHPFLRFDSLAVQTAGDSGEGETIGTTEPASCIHETAVTAHVLGMSGAGGDFSQPGLRFWLFLPRSGVERSSNSQLHGGVGMV